MAERSWVGAPATIILFSLINLGLVISAITYLPGFTTAVTSVQTSLKGFSDTLMAASKLMTSTGPAYTITKLDGSLETVTSLASSVAAAAAFAGELATTINAISFVAPDQTTRFVGSEYPSFPAHFLAAQTALASAGTLIASAATPISTAATALSTAVEIIPFNTVKRYVFLGGVIVLGVIIGTITIQSFMVCRNRVACCMFKGLAVLSVTLTSLIFILAGIFYTIGIAGSDVCYDPYAVLTNYLYQSEGNNVAFTSLSFYLTCSASTPTTGTFLATLSDASTGIVSAETSRAGGAAAVAVITGTIPSLVSSFDEMSAYGLGLIGISTSLGAGANAVRLVITDVLSCLAVAKLIDPLIAGLCTGVASSIGLSRILIAAGALLSLQLAFGVSVCCNHPGDATAWNDEKPINTSTSTPPLASIVLGSPTSIYSHDRISPRGGAPKSIAVSMV